MTRDDWEKVTLFLPLSMVNRAVIAGGFAADEDKAKDVDLWVLASPGVVEHARIQEWLDNTKVAYAGGNGVFYGGRYLVATIPEGLGARSVQLLTTDYGSVEGLLDSFDISTHSVAKQFVGPVCHTVHGSKWTSLTDQPRVLRFSTPVETLVRLEKICARYGLEANDEDLDALASHTFDDVQTISLLRAA